ncbi:MAG: alpha/beta hydrolase [Planctomycetota bacterium]
MPAVQTLTLTPAPGVRLVADHLPGRRPGVVYLHGLTSVRRGEKSEAVFARARARGMEAWRFDMRGHGESSGTLSTTTLTDLVDDTTAVLRDIGPAFLFGSSLGGLVAAWTTTGRPQAVAGLLLLAPALRFLPRLRARLDDSGRLTLPHGGGVLEFGPEVLADFESHDESLLGPSLSCPVLCVHGALDDTVPVDCSRDLLARIPHRRKKLVVFDEGDHRLNREIGTILDEADRFFAW